MTPPGKDQTGEKISGAGPGKIVMYVTGWCPYCQRARSLLTQKGLEYREINVEDGAGLREEMMARSGRRTVPQIFVGDTHIGGCDDLIALDAAGGLDRLIRGLDERGENS